MEEKYTRVFRVPLFEYVKDAIGFLIICYIAYAIGGGFGWFLFIASLILLIVRWIGFYVISVYMDDTGVFVYRGILPWTRGTYSIGWQDCGGAAYKQGFISYIFKSYVLTINHRFTNSSNIVVRGIGRGNEFVELVNEYLAKLHQCSSQDKANKINH